MARRLGAGTGTGCEFAGRTKGNAPGDFIKTLDLFDAETQ
jgi:hypothetical protein